MHKSLHSKNNTKNELQNIVHQDNSHKPSIFDFDVNVIEVDDPELQTYCYVVRE